MKFHLKSFLTSIGQKKEERKRKKKMKEGRKRRKKKKKKIEIWGGPVIC